VAADQPHTDAQPEAPAPVEPEFTAEQVRQHVPADIRSVSFPISVRGYDRAAVDAYVKRVNRVIAELQVGRTPQAAVRHALDRVGQQTIVVLQEARESADKLLEAAREEADQGKEQSKAEAAKLVVNASADADRTKAEAEQVLTQAREQADDILVRTRADAEQKRKQAEDEIAALRQAAETKMRELKADTEAVWSERKELLDDVHSMADRLRELARAAASRVQADEPAETDTDAPTLSEAHRQAPAEAKPGS
jgi:DivIVA domain-containing protein